MTHQPLDNNHKSDRQETTRQTSPGVALPEGVYPWCPGFRTLSGEYDYRVDDVEGRLPEALRGTLFRNGSGRNDLGGHWFPHWFDGDGMISAIRFDDTGIRYRNRYVRTQNYVDETREGRIVYRGFGKERPYGVIGNAFRQAGNVSNTSVVMHDDRLLSLWEGGPPYALDPKTLKTFGVETFDGRVRAFSAHPKIDPRSGAMYNFGLDYGRKTTLTPYRLDRAGIRRYEPIVLPYPVMNHDFVLTANHMVFCIGPILLHPMTFVLGFSSFDGALKWEGGRPTLIVVVPRDGGAPRIVETDAFFQFHFANGFEEDNALVLDLTRYPDFNRIGDVLRNYWHSDWPADVQATLVRLRVDLSTGKVTTKRYPTGTANEFPRVDPRRVAARYRYAYIASNPPDRARGLQQRITRVDVESGETVWHDFGPNGYVGEPVFVPLRDDGEEDEGVLVTLVYDATTRRTAITGLDARDLAAKPLFVARLRHHVPFGLHGTFARDLL